MPTTTKETFKYKGIPVTRCGNQLYYGSMKEDYIVFMQILQTQLEEELEIGTKVFIQVLSTDTSLPPTERVIKQGDKRNLLNALEIAHVWLSKANSEK